MLVLGMSCSRIAAFGRGGAVGSRYGRFGRLLMSTKRVVFLGTPDVAAKSLEMIVEGSKRGKGSSEDPDYDGFEVVAVVSQPPSPSGRKMKVSDYLEVIFSRGLGYDWGPPHYKVLVFLYHASHSPHYTI